MSDQNRDASATENEEAESDEREYEVERLVTREEGAAALRRLADGVANGSIEFGEGEITATLPERFELELEYEEESAEAELEVELEWPMVDGEAVTAERESEAQDSSVETNDTDEEDKTPTDVTADQPVAEILGAGDATSNAQFELYRDRADEWRWRLVHDNGNIIADSGEGYARKATAQNGLESVMRNAPGATIIETDD